MTRFQRAVIGWTGVLIALRLLFPVMYVPETSFVSYIPGVWGFTVPGHGYTPE